MKINDLAYLVGNFARNLKMVLSFFNCFSWSYDVIMTLLLTIFDICSLKFIVYITYKVINHSLSYRKLNEDYDRGIGFVYKCNFDEAIGTI